MSASKGGSEVHPVQLMPPRNPHLRDERIPLPTEFFFHWHRKYGRKGMRESAKGT